MGVFDIFKTSKITEINDFSKTVPQTQRVVKRIYEQQQYRVKQDIKRWRTALSSAEQVHNPVRQLLYQTYNDVVLDAQVSALMSSRKQKTLSRKFRFANSAGEDMPEVTKLFNAYWFRKFLDMSLDAMFYGHSLIQFHNVIDDKFVNVELVPRPHVKPEFNLVIEHPTYAEGLRYDLPPFSNWCLGIGEPRDLGLLMKAAPLVIWKKNAMAAWSEMAEIFGMPLRVGKTNVRDEDTRKNMENMFINMGTATYGVFDTEDTIEFIESGKNDPFKIYDMLIERCNSELSKLILGQTMTTDDGSSRSQAEVHEEVSNEYGEADATLQLFTINDKLIPFMRNLGFQIPEGTFEWDTTESLGIEQQFAIDIELIKSGKFKVKASYITDTYGTPVEEVEEPQPGGAGPGEIKDLSEYY